MRRVVAFLVAVVVAGACTLGEIVTDYGEPVDLQPSELVGMWQSSGRSRLIVFDEDGSFVATGLPPGIFDQDSDGVPDPAPNRLDVWGTWSLTTPIKEGTTGVVELGLEGIAGDRLELFQLRMIPLRRDDGQIWLYFFYGVDGGDWTAYERCALACVSATILIASAARERAEQGRPAAPD